MPKAKLQKTEYTDARQCMMSDNTTSVEDALKPFSYSLTEQKGGKWIDGSDWYFKTIDFGTLPNNTTKSVAHNISNLKHFIPTMRGIAWRADGVTTPIPTALPANTSYSMELTANNTNVVVSTGYNYSAYTNCYITVCYVKTS